jgi:hypothetical protein
LHALFLLLQAVCPCRKLDAARALVGQTFVNAACSHAVFPLLQAVCMIQTLVNAEALLFLE